MITVQDLVRRFGSIEAVRGISFHVQPGEVCGFLGPNGAGKTTTIRMLTGYLPATSGAVEICGYDVLRQSLEVRRRIGYLPESVPLYREHRVREMMNLQARLHGLPRADAKQRIGEVLDRVGLLDRERQLVGNLSKGLRQRVGLAVALLPKPEVLILDEPTSGLDPLQRLEVRKLIEELASEHTVLLSSHILHEVEGLCPRVIILNRGRIAADGTRDELVRRLGHRTFVRVEAVVPDPADARRLLGGLPGAVEVTDEGRLGIHHQFNLYSDEDLREDVGALAQVKGWALRELSWNQPSLEELFARIALELDGDGSGAPAEPGAAAASAPPAPGAAPAQIQMLSPFEQASSAPAEPEPAKIVYNLNPFDGGASRDLSRPKSTGSAPGSDVVSLDPPAPEEKEGDA